MRITKRLIHRLVAGIAGGVLAEALAAIRVATNDGFGRGDLSGYAYWNALFAAYLFAIAMVLQPRLVIATRAARVLAWSAIGGAAGFLWTWIVAAALGPWILTFSFPVLHIWTIAGGVFGAIVAWQVVPEAEVRPRPWLVLLVPPVALMAVMALIFGFLLGSRYVWGRAQPEVFTFVDGFVGQVYVVRDSLRGHPVPVVNGARTYEIPPSGIFVTSSPPVDGWLRQTFLYRTTDGAARPIHARWDATIGDTPENRADTTVGVYFLHSGTRTEQDCSLGYLSFTVGRKADILEKRGVDDFETHYQRLCATRDSD